MPIQLDLSDGSLKITHGEDSLEIKDEIVCITSASYSACLLRQEGEGISLSTTHDTLVIRVGSLAFKINSEGISKMI